MPEGRGISRVEWGMMKALSIFPAALLLACATPTENEPEPTYLTCVNGLRGYNIVEVNWRKTIDWDSDWYTYSRYGKLEPGESVKIELEPDNYNLRCIGEMGAKYARYNVEITADGYTWEVTLDDKEE